MLWYDYDYDKNESSKSALCFIQNYSILVYWNDHQSRKQYSISSSWAVRKDECFPVWLKQIYILCEKLHGCHFLPWNYFVVVVVVEISSSIPQDISSRKNENRLALFSVVWLVAMGWEMILEKNKKRKQKSYWYCHCFWKTRNITCCAVRALMHVMSYKIYSSCEINVFFFLSATKIWNMH